MALDSIHKLMEQFEQQPRWNSRRQFRQVQENWSTIVGPAVACQARPVRIDRQVLHVAVVNPMWGQTLTLERTTIMDKLRQHFRIELQDIRFSSGDWYRRDGNSRTVAKAAQSPPALPEWLRQHPSFEPNAISTIALKPPQSALEGFQQWATATQQLAQHQPLCPTCRCPCPEGELRRWSVCCVCAAQTFKSPKRR